MYFPELINEINTGILIESGAITSLIAEEIYNTMANETRKSEIGAVNRINLKTRVFCDFAFLFTLTSPIRSYINCWCHINTRKKIL